MALNLTFGTNTFLVQELLGSIIILCIFRYYEMSVNVGLIFKLLKLKLEYYDHIQQTNERHSVRHSSQLTSQLTSFDMDCSYVADEMTDKI